MKQKFFLWIVFLQISLLVTTLFYHSNNLSAEPMNELPHTVRNRIFGDDRFEHAYKAAAFSKGDEVLIAVTLRPIGEDFQSQNLWLWRLDQEGKKIWEVQIKSSQKDKEENEAYFDINSLAVLENGDILLGVESINKKISIVKIAPNGHILFRKRIVSSAHQIAISKIIPAVDGTFLLIGHDSLGAFAMRLDAECNILWHRIIKLGNTDLFVDWVPTDDGTFVLIGNSGIHGQFPLGQSDVWVRKFDSDGSIQVEKTFPGRYGSVTIGQHGSYVVVYDRSDSEGQDIWVQALSSDLKDLWRVQLLDVDVGAARFKIVPMLSDDFIVVGYKHSKLWVSRINTSGKKLWEFLGDATTSSWEFDIVYANGKFIIPFSVINVITVDGKRQVNNKVRVIKFTQGN